MRLLTCAAVVCACTIAVAADPPRAHIVKKEPPAGALKSLSDKGNQRYSSAEILKATGLHVGRQVTTGEIEKARLALVDLQLFSNVANRYHLTADPAGYDVTTEVSELDQVFPMRFE